MYDIPTPRGFGDVCLTNWTGFDRDLSIAGRAMIERTDGTFVQELIKIDRPSTCRARICLETYH